MKYDFSLIYFLFKTLTYVLADNFCHCFQSLRDYKIHNKENFRLMFYSYRIKLSFNFLCLSTILNPIRAVFFYPHFSCVRARDLKFYDFLNYIKTNLVMLFFFIKQLFFAATGLGQKMVKKGLQLFRTINKFKKKFNF